MFVFFIAVPCEQFRVKQNNTRLIFDQDVIKGRTQCAIRNVLSSYSVAFEENIQVLCGLTKLVIIKRNLINRVFAVRLGTVASVEAFLSQSLTK